jgi:hypothetical protein
MKNAWTWIKDNKMIAMAAIVIVILAYNALVG